MLVNISKYSQRYFFYFLFLLAINSLSEEKWQCGYWWIEQQRFGGNFEVSRTNSPVSSGYRAFLTRFGDGFPSMIRRLILWASCWLVVILAMGGWWLLRRILAALILRGIEISELHRCWHQVLEGSSSKLHVEMKLHIFSSVPIGSQFSQQDSMASIGNALFFSRNTSEELPQVKMLNLSQSGIQLDFQGSFLREKPTKESLPIRRICQSYHPLIEEKMRRFYNTLSEKDKRRYGAIESLKLGHGGLIYIAHVLGCNRKTIARAVEEIEALSEESCYESRIRQAGGGRKGYQLTHPDIHHQFLGVLRNHTAGDPMDETVLWTNLSYNQIIQALQQDYQIQVSQGVIQKLLRANNYRRRKAQKRTSFKQVAHRNEQFEKIAQLKSQFLAKGNPVISMDSKKKEHLGNLYRDGHLYTQRELQTYDHDFPSYAEGVVIPHGLYDAKYNKAFINLGNSKDTSEFACDSLRNWWYQEGQFRYPKATSILIECDGGGSNSSRQYLFKQDLQRLVNEIGLEIRIAHYPPYASKYNPIEHRLFPHMTRACQGVVFTDIQLVKQLLEKTQTKTGLRVTVDIIDKVYQTGRKVAENFKENISIKFDEHLSNWNYRAIPNG